MKKSSVGTRRQTTFSILRTESPLASLALARLAVASCMVCPPPISFGALEVEGVASWFLRMPTRFSVSNEIVGPTEDAPYWTFSRCAEPHLGDKTSAAKLLLRRFTSIFQLWPLSPHSHTHTNTNTDTHQPRAYGRRMQAYASSSSSSPTKARAGVQGSPRMLCSALFSPSFQGIGGGRRVR